MVCIGDVGVMNTYYEIKEKIANCSVFVIFLSLMGVVPIWIVSIIALGIRAIIVKYKTKFILYICSFVTIMIAIIFTIGIVQSHPKKVSSTILKKWEEIVYAASGPQHLIKITCEDAEAGSLIANLMSSQYNMLNVGDIVTLGYHSESILGMWHHQLVPNSINSRKVLSGGGKGFHGGILDIGPLFILVCGIYILYLVNISRYYLI